MTSMPDSRTTVAIKRTISLRVIFFAILALIGFCSGGGLVTLLVAKGASSRRLQLKVEQLSSSGIPMDDKSLESLHERLSSSENARVWASALEQLDSDTFLMRSAGLPIVGSGSLDITNPGVTWNDQAAVEQFLSDYASTLQPLIDVAQDNTAVLYPIQFKASDFPLPSRASIIKAARVLQLEAIVAHRQGDAEREFRAINAMVGCALSIRGEPMLQSQVFSNSVHGMAVSRIQAAIEGDRLTPEQLAMLRKRLDIFSDINQPFNVGLMGELSIGTRAVRDGVVVNQQYGRFNGLLFHSGITDRAAIRLADRLKAALDTPTDDLQSFVAMCNSLDAVYANGGGVEQIQNSLSLSFCPSLGAIAENLVRCRMLNDLATLAIAIRQFEHSNGRLPESLDELASEGINLDSLSCLDGKLPGYFLRGDANAPIVQGRAVLWSFDPRSLDSNSISTVPAAPPNMPSNKKLDHVDKDPWQWDFE